MRNLTLEEIGTISGGREVQGAYSTHGPDRTRSQAMRENHTGRDFTSSDLRNAGLALGAIGSFTPGLPGRVIAAIGASSALIGGWESGKSSGGNSSREKHDHHDHHGRH